MENGGELTLAEENTLALVLADEDTAVVRQEREELLEARIAERAIVRYHTESNPCGPSNNPTTSSSLHP